MYLTDILSPESVRVDVEVSGKEGVIAALLDLITGLPEVVDEQAVRESVEAREASMSTGVGKGLALPHGKTAGVTDTVAALVLLRSPVDFASIDDEPVRLAFLLVGPLESKSQHVKILSRISRLMNRDGLRARLFRATSADELLTILSEGERALLEA